MGVTGTAKADAAWRWVQLITDRDNGVLQVTGGAGSPGARRDVWEDSRLLGWDPVYALMQRSFGQPAPLHYPANFTFPEVRKVAEDALASFWANAASVGDATAAIVREADEILRRPAR
jgi:ABC-type glycerol-3-phosphate transport system substrate-binding protein